MSEGPLASQEPLATIGGMPTVSRPKSPRRASGAPVCVGSGFVALDLIFEGKGQGEPAFTFAGGSCGNVLAILSYLAWDTIPVIRLKNDDEARKLVADLERWKVNTKFVSTEPKGTTPVVVQRICTSINGDPYHKFEWRCPNTGLWLPRYRPLPQRLAIELSTKLPKATAFYFDRATTSSLLLAEKARDEGAVIFFEPSSVKDEKMFCKAVALADILKYSDERISVRPRCGVGPRLEVQTLGKLGLRYRVSDERRGTWQKLPALAADQFKDSAGAGDWCSAGIIDSLAQKGRAGLLLASAEQIASALKFGQALAAINCDFAGARGSMYQMTATAMRRRAKAKLAPVSLRPRKRLKSEPTSNQPLKRK